MARPSQYSHAIESTLFLWHMPDDTTESVAKQSSSLQPLNNWKLQLQPLCSIALVNNVLSWKYEDSGKPCAVPRQINNYSKLNVQAMSA